jgi:DNA-binding protein HU-beta
MKGQGTEMIQRPQLVDSIATATKLPKSHVNLFLETFLSTIQANLKKGNGVQITGYMTFTPTNRKARVGRNPHTGEALKIPARRVVKVKIGTKLNAVLRK